MTVQMHMFRPRDKTMTALSVDGQPIEYEDGVFYVPPHLMHAMRAEALGPRFEDLGPEPPPKAAPAAKTEAPTVATPPRPEPPTVASPTAPEK